jgi:hypothetical protein
MEPAAQAAHADVDMALYFPTVHAVHVVPPVDASVLVTEPALQAKQFAWPSLPWYWPAAHGVHSNVDTLLYCPSVQAVHVVPPADTNVLVMDPAAHDSHADVDRTLY